MKNVSNVTDIFQFQNYLNTYKIVKGNCRNVHTHSWLCYYIYTNLIHSSSERDSNFSDSELPPWRPNDEDEQQ